MNENICGYGDHSKFFAGKTQSEIEFVMIGSQETICSAKFPDGTEKTFTLPNDYIVNAIKTGALEPKKVEQWLIQREEDKAYFTLNNRWSKKFDKAGHFDDEIVDSLLAVMRDRGYKAQKIAL